MDNISIAGVVSVSFPETLLFMILGILAIGKFNFLKQKENIIRLFISSLVATVAFYFMRNMAETVLENLLLTLFLYALLLIFIMNLKFYESIIASIIMIAMVVIIEAAYLGPLLAFTGISIEQMYASDLKRFLYSSPERVIQIGLILLSFKYKLKIIDFENSSENKRGYFVQIIVILLTASTLIFLAAVITKTLLFGNADIASPTNASLLRINVYLTLFVTVILLLAVRSTDEFHKNKRDLNNKELSQSLDYISKLLDDRNYNEAKESVKNLKDHITSKHK